jgi:hypothetical protein
MTLVDPGSVNVGLTRDGTVPPAAAEGPYQNSYADIDYMFRRSAELGGRGPGRAAGPRPCRVRRGSAHPGHL